MAILGVLTSVVAASAQQKPSAADIHAELVSGQLLARHGQTPVCTLPQLPCLAEAVTTTPGSTTALSTSAPAGYGPANLAAAYELPPASVGVKGTIALIEADAYPNLESDLATYRAQYGLPPCTTANGCLTVADYHGGPPLPASGSPQIQSEEEEAAFETALDVDMASAACPHCRVTEIQAPPTRPLSMADNETNFGTAVDTAVKLGANAVSISYGFLPTPTGESGAAAHSLFHPGVAVVASSGDAGAIVVGQNYWPQNLPWVVSAGGTSLLPTNAGATRFTEQAWGDSGSGCETDVASAIGQPSAVSANCDGHRAGSDISADADPNTGVAIYDTYAPASHQPVDWTILGGTSASSPYLAGLYARGGQTARVIGPNTLYAAPPSAFNDITFGQNAPLNRCQNAGRPVVLCDAGQGWDGPTGLGSPNGLAPFQPSGGH
jgi:subtilase family serine protease